MSDEQEIQAMARRLAADLGLGYLDCRTPESPICRNRDEGCDQCGSEAAPEKLATIVAALSRLRAPEPASDDELIEAMAQEMFKADWGDEAQGLRLSWEDASQVAKKLYHRRARAALAALAAERERTIAQCKDVAYGYGPEVGNAVAAIRNAKEPK